MEDVAALQQSGDLFFFWSALKYFEVVEYINVGSRRSQFLLIHFPRPTPMKHLQFYLERLENIRCYYLFVICPSELAEPPRLRVGKRSILCTVVDSSGRLINGSTNLVSCLLLVCGV